MQWQTDSSGNESFTMVNPGAVIQAPKSLNSTMKSFTFEITTSTTVVTIQNLYTVTTGKTFYLTDFCVYSNGTPVAKATVNASQTAGTSPIFTGYVVSGGAIQALNIGTEFSVGSGVPMSFQAAATSTAVSLAVTISGYEV